MDLPMDVRDKFDAALDEVKEPQSELSLAELGLVKKLSYHKAEAAIVVHMNFATHDPATCPACFITTDMMKDSIERDLKASLLEKFPGFRIEFAG
jgi:metal-sulfur cluster biosynthetic enzyme